MIDVLSREFASLFAYFAASCHLLSPPHFRRTSVPNINYCYMYILHNKGNKVRRSDPYHNAYITSFSDWKLTSTTKKVASNRCTAPNKHKKKI